MQLSLSQVGSEGGILILLPWFPGTQAHKLPALSWPLPLSNCCSCPPGELPSAPCHLFWVLHSAGASVHLSAQQHGNVPSTMTLLLANSYTFPSPTWLTVGGLFKYSFPAVIKGAQILLCFLPHFSHNLFLPLLPCPFLAGVIGLA